MSDHLRELLLSTGLLPLAAGGLMLVMILIGRRVGSKIRTRTSGESFKADETIVGAVFGLLALIMAFTFSGASDRYDHRRELIAKEVSTIGTAYASIDLLPMADQPRLRESFRELVDERINLYQEIVRRNGYEKRLEQFEKTRNQLWTEAVRSVKKPLSLKSSWPHKFSPKFRT